MRARQFRQIGRKGSFFAHFPELVACLLIVAILFTYLNVQSIIKQRAKIKVAAEAIDIVEGNYAIVNYLKTPLPQDINELTKHPIEGPSARALLQQYPMLYKGKTYVEFLDSIYSLSQKPNNEPGMNNALSGVFKSVTWSVFTGNLAKDAGKTPSRLFVKFPGEEESSGFIVDLGQLGPTPIEKLVKVIIPLSDFKTAEVDFVMQRVE